MSSNGSTLKALSKFQCRIMRFVRTREHNLRKDRIEPLQFQFLTRVDPVYPGGQQPNISDIATQLGMHHHCAVEMVNRLVHRGFLRRKRANHDRRQVLLALTPEGKRVLKRVIQQEYADVHEFAPELLHDLKVVLDGAGSNTRSSNGLHH